MTLIRSIEADLKVVKAEFLSHPEFDVAVLHRSIRSKLTAGPHILNFGGRVDLTASSNKDGPTSGLLFDCCYFAPFVSERRVDHRTGPLTFEEVVVNEVSLFAESEFFDNSS
jgi:hypothetical protein